MRAPSGVFSTIDFMAEWGPDTELGVDKGSPIDYGTLQEYFRFIRNDKELRCIDLSAK